MQHQGISKVVDVFTCAGEVKELFVLVKTLLVFRKLFLEEVLDSLDVVISCRLNRLDPLSILQGELIEDLVQEGLLFKDELNIFLSMSSDLFLKQSFEPLDLNEHAIFHQSIFREIPSQIV